MSRTRPVSVRFASSSPGRMTMGSEALELKRDGSEPHHVVIVQFLARQGVGSVVEEGAVGGIQIGEIKLVVFVAQAGVTGGNGGVADHDIGLGAGAQDVLPVAHAKVLALLLAVHGDEPADYRGLSLLGEKHSLARAGR